LCLPVGAVAADEAEADDINVRTFKRGSVQVTLFANDADEMLSIEVLVATYNAKGQLVWLEMYLYKPNEGEIIVLEDAQGLARMLLSEPVLEAHQLAVQVHLIRHDILWDATNPGAIAGTYATLEPPAERSPDSF
jgi:hypothetical protein